MPSDAMSAGETAQDVSGWTTDTLRMALIREIENLAATFDHRIDALEDRLSERYATQTKAVDAAFAAQQLAMVTAFSAADKAVAAALESAEKAVTKAETASEKRFDAVNEFRGQLADQAQLFYPRNEAAIALSAIQDKLDSSITRATERFSDVNRQLDRSGGAREGTSDRDQKIMATIGAVSGIAVVISVLIAVFALLP